MSKKQKWEKTSWTSHVNSPASPAREHAVKERKPACLHIEILIPMRTFDLSHIYLTECGALCNGLIASSSANYLALFLLALFLSSFRITTDKLYSVQKSILFFRDLSMVRICCTYNACTIEAIGKWREENPHWRPGGRAVIRLSIRAA